MSLSRTNCGPISAKRYARFGLAALAFASVLTAGSAGAATLSLSGGSIEHLLSSFDPGGWVPSNNDNIVGGSGGPNSEVTVFSNGSTGGLYVDAATKVTFTYLGTEAAYENLSFSALSLLFNNKTTGLNAAVWPV